MFEIAPLDGSRVAIPRLKGSEHKHDVSQARKRVLRACTKCHSQKTKCTGERPRCRRCETANYECVYNVLKRDKLKIATDTCQQMANLLNKMKAYATAEDDMEIDEILETVGDFYSLVPNEDKPKSFESVPLEGCQREQSAVVPCHEADHDVPNNILKTPHWDCTLESDRVESVTENLHASDSVRAIGFVGMSSEVRWLQSVAAGQSQKAVHCVEPYSRAHEYDLFGLQASSFAYWADSASIGSTEMNLDPYELPSTGLAERLLSCYMLKVHASFPILARTTFESQFRMYFTALEHGNPPRLSPKWQANLNLVFAISATYAFPTGAKRNADEGYHRVFQARAQALTLNTISSMDPTDVPRIQNLGLSAFYCLSIGQVSRAWTVVGTALQSAYSLGLHLRNDDPSASSAKRERLSHVWWSLYSLELLLSTMTGRPSMVVDTYCSVPTPFPVQEARVVNETDDLYRPCRQRASDGLTNKGAINDPSRPQHAIAGVGFDEANADSYFTASVELCIVVRAVLSSLYSAASLARSSEAMRQEMTGLDRRLDQWVASLPNELNFKKPVNRLSTTSNRGRRLLGFQLCSARILLGRQCLHAHAEKQSVIFDCEASFVQRMSGICLKAAKTIIDLLPDEPKAEFIYDHCPWWCFVHHLMQAASVLLLGLSCPRTPPQDGIPLIQYMNKAIHWLQVMDNAVAERAEHSLRSLVGRSAVAMYGV